tara:strand:- start:9964 stop:10758 length:795 start_codon:yes stop_codon:yes gene_type:complete
MVNGEYFDQFSNCKEEYLNCKNFEEMFNYCPFCKPHSTGNISGLKKVYSINNELTKEIMNKNNYNIDKIKPEDIDFVSSNNYIFCILIFHYLKKMNHQMSNCNIIDIGGGFGNCRRLLSDYYDIFSYIVFDLDITLHFNKLYLDTYDNSYKLFHNEKLNEVGFYNISPNFRDEFNLPDKLDLVIASHSLSEISLEEFNWYIENVIQKCSVLFYSCQKKDTGYSPCSDEVINKKIKILKSCMNLYDELPQPGEEGNCSVFIFIKK